MEQSKVQQLKLELEEMKNPSILAEFDVNKTGPIKTEKPSVSVKAKIHELKFDPWTMDYSLGG